ncbi:MAG TPA: hypothetical protein VIJ09_12885 [Acidimicrobiales bacterium]
MTTDQQIAHSQVADHRRWLAAGWPLAGHWWCCFGQLMVVWDGTVVSQRDGR